MHGIAELMPNPSLDFELITILFGVNSITLYYKGVRGFAAEVFISDSKEGLRNPVPITPVTYDAGVHKR